MVSSIQTILIIIKMSGRAAQWKDGESEPIGLCDCRLLFLFSLGLVRKRPWFLGSISYLLGSWGGLAFGLTPHFATLFL